MKRLTLLTTLSLAGCASVSPVAPLGDGKYMVGYEVRGGLTSWSEVKAQALLQAQTFCTGQGKQPEVLDIKTRGARGWSPQNAEVTFKCVSG